MMIRSSEFHREREECGRGEEIMLKLRQRIYDTVNLFFSLEALECEWSIFCLMSSMSIGGRNSLVDSISNLDGEIVITLHNDGHRAQTNSLH